MERIWAMKADTNVFFHIFQFLGEYIIILPVDISIEKIVVGDIQTNCYLVTCSKTGESMIIDPGDEYEKINRVITKKKSSPSFIVNTHGHADHIKEDEKFHLPVYIHRLDAECLHDPEKNLSAFFGDGLVVDVDPSGLEEGDTVRVGKIVFEVIHTPGHSPGSICLKSGNTVFTGDTLFCGGYGRTDLPGGSEKELFSSIRTRLMVLPDETIIYPGHGPSSTIGAEREFFR